MTEPTAELRWPDDFLDCISTGPLRGEVGYIGEDDDLREYPCNCVYCQRTWIEAVLARDGLAIVEAQGAAVLDALDDVSDQELRDAIASPVTSYEVTAFARAELARREPEP